MLAGNPASMAHKYGHVKGKFIINYISGCSDYSGNSATLKKQKITQSVSKRSGHSTHCIQRMRWCWKGWGVKHGTRNTAECSKARVAFRSMDSTRDVLACAFPVQAAHGGGGPVHGCCAELSDILCALPFL